MQNLERVQIADQAKKFPGQLSGVTAATFSNCKSIGAWSQNYVI